MEIDLTQITVAVADALDYAQMDGAQHSKRVAYIATETARMLGWSEAAVTDTLHAALLHDCGRTAEFAHRDERGRIDLRGCPEREVHCLRGYGLLSHFAPFAHLAEPVLYHHTPWPTLMEMGVEEPTARVANLLMLADHVELLIARLRPAGSILTVRETIRGVVAQRVGRRLNHDLVVAFLALSRRESFWFGLTAHHLDRSLQRICASRRHIELDTEQVKRLTALFSDIVDAKSPFTHEHSAGVARTARWLGERWGLDGEVCDQLEIAGYLHDLGKLRVPSAILDKPGALAPGERAVMMQHAYDTYRCLSRIDGMERICEWASYHHEHPTGSGYPFRLDGRSLGVEARIVAVADVFQALIQERPYRDAMPLERVSGILRKESAAHHLDPEVAALLLERPEAAWHAAAGTSTPTAEMAVGA